MSKPFRLILPDLGRLYELLEAWIDRHRSRLIGAAADPNTLFVKTAKMTSTNAAYCQNTFYEAWRTAIQRYGIYNPWSERGAIKGLLPHGPHNVRDVLATHILKQTGSYEQASYAIQDTAEMVAQHYGRFLPQDKAEIAARISIRSGRRPEEIAWQGGNYIALCHERTMSEHHLCHADSISHGSATAENRSIVNPIDHFRHHTSGLGEIPDALYKS